MNHKKYVKFTGKFTDLIPNGWKFQKLFASNYRRYHKTCDGQKYSQGCSILQSRGGYLEICDLYSNSWRIVELIKTGEISNCAVYFPKLDNPNEFEPSYWFIIDLETGEFISGANKEKYISINKYFMGIEEFSSKEDRKKFFNKYRHWSMNPDLIPFVQDLLDRGWIKVEIDNRKK